MRVGADRARPAPQPGTGADPDALGNLVEALRKGIEKVLSTLGIHELRGYGWQVPAYTMPDNATNVSVLRIVVREGLSADLARALHDDAVKALGSLDKVKPGGHYDAEHFAH